MKFVALDMPSSKLQIESKPIIHQTVARAFLLTSQMSLQPPSERRTSLVCASRNQRKPNSSSIFIEKSASILQPTTTRNRTSAMTPLSSETRERLMRRFRPATLATILFKRGLRSQFIQGVPRLSSKPLKMWSAPPSRCAMSRPAKTSTPSTSSVTPSTRSARRSRPCAGPCAGDGLPRRPFPRASAGGILATRAMIRDAPGLFTDGGLRDADEIAELDMPTYCASRSAPTSLTRHHAVDLNV